MTHLLVFDVLWLSKLLLWVCFLLETLTSKMPKFMTNLALILFCWACESFPVDCITTLWTPVVVVWRCSLFEVGGKWLPFIFWPCCGSLPQGSLLLPCLGFVWDFFFLYLYWGSSLLWWCNKLIWAAWGSPDTCFICLAVAFELSNFLANWHTLLAGNLSKSMLPSLMVLDTKSSSLRKNQKMSLCSILAVSKGYLAKFTCTCMALYHSSMLQFPWWKLVSRSNLAQTSFDCSLQYSSYFPHMVSRVSSLEGRFQDTYWSMPQSPLQAMIFLHCWHSGSATSLHSRMFLHLRWHLRNLRYRLSFTVQSICGPSM